MRDSREGGRETPGLEEGSLPDTIITQCFVKEGRIVIVIEGLAGIQVDCIAWTPNVRAIKGRHQDHHLWCSPETPDVRTAPFELHDKTLQHIADSADCTLGKAAKYRVRGWSSILQQASC